MWRCFVARELCARDAHATAADAHPTCAWDAVGIGMAQRDGVDWLLHVDTDELIYPSGSPDYSLQVRIVADSLCLCSP